MRRVKRLKTSHAQAEQPSVNPETNGQAGLDKCSNKYPCSKESLSEACEPMPMEEIEQSDSDLTDLRTVEVRECTRNSIIIEPIVESNLVCKNS